MFWVRSWPGKKVGGGGGVEIWTRLAADTELVCHSRAFPHELVRKHLRHPVGKYNVMARVGSRSGVAFQGCFVSSYAEPEDQDIQP